MYAISSAALAYTLARACSAGALHHCTCSSPPGAPPAANFKWGGCGDNLKYAKNFAKRFLDNAEKRHLVVARKGFGDKNRLVAVNLHNNRVGRKVCVCSICGDFGFIWRFCRWLRKVWRHSANVMGFPAPAA